MINHWNFLNKEIMGIGSDKPMIAKGMKPLDAGTMRKTARFVGAALVLNELYKSQGLRAPYPDPAGAIISGQENNESAYEILMGVAGEFAEVVPFVGNVKFGKVLPPVVDVTNALVTGGKYGKTPKQEIGRMIDEGEIPENTLEQLMRIGGVPGANQLFKSIRAANRGNEGLDIITGRYEK
jgi:hypothetical protein